MSEMSAKGPAALPFGILVISFWNASMSMSVLISFSSLGVDSLVFLILCFSGYNVFKILIFVSVFRAIGVDWLSLSSAVL